MGGRLVKKTSICEFPGGLVIKIQWFHCHGQGLIPGQGTEIPKDIRCREKKKKTKLIHKSFFNKYVLSVYFVPSTHCPRFWEYWNQLERRDHEKRLPSDL